MSSFSSDNKEYMTLQAYVDGNFSEKVKNRYYKVMVNPETFNKNMSVGYNNNSATKISISNGEFSKMDSITYDFSLILDGTGIINSKRRDIKKELDDLMDVLFTKYDNGLGYSPNYVAISFCGDVFHCQIRTFRIEYQLFNPNGSPLRVKVTCNFSSTCKLIKEDQNIPEETKKDSCDSMESTLNNANENEKNSLYNE